MSNLLSTLRLRGDAEAATARMTFAERLFARWLSELRVGRLTVEFPSGAGQTFGEPNAARRALLKIDNLRTVVRTLLSGDLGLAEGYMAGEWDTPDLSALLMLGAQNATVLSDTLSAGWFTTLLNRVRHVRRANTRAGSKRNIAAHYDLGNEFYRLWLDDGMTYSSALFADTSDSLAEAQRQKYMRIAQRLNLRPGDHVLEIGCGWGGFAEIAAAECGCEVVGLTLSEEQARYARDRMARAGLSDRVDIRLQDYRDVGGRYDKIVSIEMFEAVGQENWATYFETLDRCLVPGGRAALQVITIADEKFEAYRCNPDFIQRYIFPGGMLPSPAVFEHAVGAAGWRVADEFFFGTSYAETLRRWADVFQTNWSAIEQLGFDERFRRMWRYYLSYCEVGFDTGQIDVGQFLIERR
jgi:cyclopropane-fatty-acyl-phospholipid synthase